MVWPEIYQEQGIGRKIEDDEVRKGSHENSAFGVASIFRVRSDA